MNLAKAKWKNLKDKFRIEFKKLPAGRSGAGAEQYDGKWPFFKIMMFIKDTIAPSPTEGNLDSQSTSGDCEENDEGLEYTVTDSDKESIASPALTTPARTDSRPNSRSTNTSQNYRKKKAAESDIDKYLDMERQKLEILRGEQNRDSANPDYHFLMSLLPYFQQFEPLEKMELRTTIQNVIINALIKKQNTSQHMQEEKAPPAKERHQPFELNTGQNNDNICEGAFGQNQEFDGIRLYRFP